MDAKYAEYRADDAGNAKYLEAALFQLENPA